MTPWTFITTYVFPVISVGATVFTIWRWRKDVQKHRIAEARFDTDRARYELTEMRYKWDREVSYKALRDLLAAHGIENYPAVNDDDVATYKTNHKGFP